MLARYMVDNNVTRSNQRDPKFVWAKKTHRDLKRATRRIVKLYEFHLNEDDEVYRVRRRVRGSRKKKKVNYTKPVFKYGVEVPRNTAHARRLDEQNGDTMWGEAIKREIDTLMELKCFDFKAPGYNPGPDFQLTKLHCVYDVKHDLRRKARLVAGGHLIDVPTDVQIYSSQVKPISVKLLHVISHKMGLKQLCGDIGNAYVNAYTSEKVYAVAGNEFGEHEGAVLVIRKALYGLRSASSDWWKHFANSLRSYGFKPTRHDRDVWIRLSQDGSHYEYICSHVDDFCICSKAPEEIMERIKAEYVVKGEGPPDYYLGNDYKRHLGRWAVGCKKYITEAIKRVEGIFGRLTKTTLPLPAGIHPEEDTSAFLCDDDHRKYQMLIGMLNWVVGIGRFDIAHATTSLARFNSCPREGHLKLALRVFSYLKRRKNRRIVMDSREPIVTGADFAEGHAMAEKLREDYPEATEEIDASLPAPLVDELATTVFVDADHGHDKVTRRSMTGIVILVGRTPVFTYSKRQGAVATSTYSAEFAAMRTAVEEVIAIRYMLRSLGVKVEHAALMCGDNLGVIQNTTIKDSLLKKKCVALSFHRCREAVAANIVQPVKIHTKDNYADAQTKSLPQGDFDRLNGGLLYG
jgi:hypothetical protein